MPDYPRCDPKGYVFEHIVMVERVLGKPLRVGADVHHIDEDKAHNANDNFVVCEDRAYHMLLHRRARALAACGNPNALICSYCHEYDDPSNMSVYERSDAAGVKSYHKDCAAKYQSRPDRAALRHAYLNRPDVKEHSREYQREYAHEHRRKKAS